MPPRTVPHERLRIDAASVARRLERFIEATVRHRFGFERVVVGLSGGVDGAVVAALAARALGPHGVLALQLPYRDLGSDGRPRAQRLIDALGLENETIDVTAVVDAYADTRATMTWHRRGNVQARVRMLVQFDLMVERGALPLGTSNKTELLFGYFTEHGDAAPRLQPLGDLYKTQVWQLAEHLDLPPEIVDAVPSAGLEPDQTDEADLGLTYAEADLVLVHLDAGFDDEAIRALGVAQATIDAARARVLATHRKRLPSLVPQVQPAPTDPTAFLRGALPRPAEAGATRSGSRRRR